MSVSCRCCVLSSRGPCLGLVTRPEEYYRMWRVCIREASIMRRPWSDRGCCIMEEKITNYPQCLRDGVGISQHGQTFNCERFSVGFSTAFSAST
jgi:hypothetical protein